MSPSDSSAALMAAEDLMIDKIPNATLEELPSEDGSDSDARCVIFSSLFSKLACLAACVTSKFLNEKIANSGIQ